MLPWLACVKERGGAQGCWEPPGKGALGLSVFQVTGMPVSRAESECLRQRWGEPSEAECPSAPQQRGDRGVDLF